MIGNSRGKNIISQHVEVALIYKDMLGLEDAAAYLARENIPREVAERVLFSEHRRRQDELPCLGEVVQACAVTCRRKNWVQDAIVEAALTIERKHGLDGALALLKAEQVPEAVARRVLAEGPRQIRARHDLA